MPSPKFDYAIPHLEAAHASKEATTSRTRLLVADDEGLN